MKVCESFRLGHPEAKVNERKGALVLKKSPSLRRGQQQGYKQTRVSDAQAIANLGGWLLMMGQHDRSESLFYYFRIEDQVPENHLLRFIDRE